MNRPIVSTGIAVSLIIFAASLASPVSTAVKNRLPQARPAVQAKPVIIPQSIVLELNGGSFTCQLAGRTYLCRVPRPPGARTGPRT